MIFEFGGQRFDKIFILNFQDYFVRVFSYRVLVYCIYEVYKGIGRNVGEDVGCFRDLNIKKRGNFKKC